MVFDLTDEIKEMEVKEYVEVEPVLDFQTQGGETRYNLEEYMELEKKLTGAQSVAETHDPVLLEDELVFEKKTIKTEAALGDDSENSGTLDPVNSSISDMLKERADARRRTMKDFNYKFKSSINSIDDIEKEPAYKRQGVDLEDGPRDKKVSPTSLSEDSNDEIQIRTNNSFLHGNVD